MSAEQSKATAQLLYFLKELIKKLRAFARSTSDSKLIWPASDELRSLNNAVTSIYLVKRQRLPPAFWKAVEGVDSDHPSLALKQTILDFVNRVAGIPLRPVAQIMTWIKKENPTFSHYDALYTGDSVARQAHERALSVSDRYRLLFEFLETLSHSDSATEFKGMDLIKFLPLLEKLAQKSLLFRWNAFAPDAISGGAKDLKALILFLEVRNRELSWRLHYFDVVNHVAMWVAGLQNRTLDKAIDRFGVIGQPTLKAELSERTRRQTKERVARFRKRP